jgi:2,3-bisphosphoglycerate-independent phosphoglycerate mutase
MMHYLSSVPEVQTYYHAVLDGRDTPPQSAAQYLSACDFPIHSVIGRYYAMDRDQRWERTQLAYDLYVQGQANYSADNPLAALEMAYARGETDEFVHSTRIAQAGEYAPGIQAGDIVLMMNFRSDRFRQLAYAFTQPMAGMKAQPVCSVNLATLSAYAADLTATVLVTKPLITETLGACVAAGGLRQLRLAETEKYAHVTYFINGGREAPLAQEERVLIPSPQVATYDLQPEMSAEAVTDALVAAITSDTYDLIICNYANPDMVGHTGNFEAAKTAVQVMDTCLARVVTAIESVGGQALITADHGNIELMYDVTTDQPHTAHTSHVVPLLLIAQGVAFNQSVGTLVDVAPTLLRLLGLPQPPEMTGQSLVDVP